MNRTMNVETQLKGMPVITTDTGERLGEVIDAIVDPTEGTVLGLALKSNEDENRAVPASMFRIGVDAVMVTGRIGRDRDKIRKDLSRGVMACGDLVGTSVVSEDGTNLGSVREVYISTDGNRDALRIVESSLQQLFGGGFYVPGDLPRSYAGDGGRMIVPSDTRERYGKTSLDEVWTSPKTHTATARR